VKLEATKTEITNSQLTGIIISKPEYSNIELAFE